MLFPNEQNNNSVVNLAFIALMTIWPRRYDRWRSFVRLDSEMLLVWLLNWDKESLISFKFEFLHLSTNKCLSVNRRTSKLGVLLKQRLRILRDNQLIRGICAKLILRKYALVAGWSFSFKLLFSSKPIFRLRRWC
jgi:hypothetical protein